MSSPRAIAGALCVAIFLFFILCVAPHFTNAYAPPAPPSIEPFFAAVRIENYAEAKRLADVLLAKASPADRIKLTVAYGRVLLGLGDKESARKYLQVLAQQKLDVQAEKTLVVYTAWLKALDGNPDGAIADLEKFVKEQEKTPSAAEAAEVLSALYLSRGKPEQAKKMAEFGLATLKYLKTSTDYLEALLNRRLQNNAPQTEEEKLYVAAEKLRAAGKFREAGKGYTQVITQFPKSVWAAASTFRVGQCLLGLGQPQQALDHWKTFITAAPAGPWRGQARVALVDLALESNLDLAVASEHSIAASATLAKGAEGDAATSWKDAAFDIYLRQGIVSLVEARFDAAAIALQSARQTVPPGGGELAAGIDRLIVAAQSRAPLLPGDLADGDRRTVVALSLGTLNLVLRKFEPAQKYFGLPLAGSGRTTSAAHRSFALQGLARSTAAGSPKDAKPATLAKAKSYYQQSYKEHAIGAWHDETLRELALLIERMAADLAQAAPKPAANGAAPKAAAAERAAPRPDVAMRAEALPHWALLLTNYPQSRHIAQALFHSGRLYAEAGKPDQALAAFSQLLKDYPASPWTGDGAIYLIDVKLEQQFDLPGAATLAAQAVTWYESLDQAAVAQASREYANYEMTGLRSFQATGYQIYLRAGLVEYLQVHKEATLAFFKKAEPLQPPRGFVVASGQIPTGIEKLIRAARNGTSLTPTEVRDGDERARLMLMLADAYHNGEEWNKSLTLCGRVLNGAAPKATSLQKSWAHFVRGRNYFCLEDLDKQPMAALTDYLEAITLARQSPWASESMLLAANIHWNFFRDANKAIALHKQLVRDYPNSQDAPLSAYLIGVLYEWSGDTNDARLAYEAVQKTYGDSPYANGARKRLIKLDGTLHGINK